MSINKFVLIMMLIVSSVLFTSCTLQSGYTKDKLQGYDRGILWNHLYLLNDHSTVYCFKNNVMYESLLDSIKNNNNVTIIVSYQKYLFTGRLCESGQGLEAVVITNIEVIK